MIMETVSLLITNVMDMMTVETTVMKNIVVCYTYPVPYNSYFWGGLIVYLREYCV